MSINIVSVNMQYNFEPIYTICTNWNSIYTICILPASSYNVQSLALSMVNAVAKNGISIIKSAVGHNALLLTLTNRYLFNQPSNHI